LSGDNLCATFYEVLKEGKAGTSEEIKNDQINNLKKLRT